MPSHLRLLNFCFFLSISSVVGCGSTPGGAPAGSAGAGNAPNAGAAGTAAAGSAGSETGGAGSTGGTGALADCTSNGGASPANTTPRAECTAPAASRNLFNEVLCKSPADVQAKMASLVSSSFTVVGKTKQSTMSFLPTPRKHSSRTLPAGMCVVKGNRTGCSSLSR